MTTKPIQSKHLIVYRTVRFGETDSAGVMHFHKLLRWCHEAYEESLERFGLNVAEIFPTPGCTPEIALPIVHCSADFRRPLICGSPLAISLQPTRLDPCCFEVNYSFNSEDQLVANGLTRHIAIGSSGRQRCELPEGINRWLEASALQGGIQPL